MVKICIISAKYFKDHGWIGTKSRDRNYRPQITFKQSIRDGIERCLLYDSLTKYTEGLNEYGVAVINSATAVIDDEKEVNLARMRRRKQGMSRGTYSSKDGAKIRKSLLEKTPKKVLKKLIDLELKGNTLIFDPEECYLLEADFDEVDKKKKDILKRIDPKIKFNAKYVYKHKEIPKDQVIVRTNHGVFLEYSGYPKDTDDEYMQRSRKSSEIRYKRTLKELKKVKYPKDMFNAISYLDDEDFQMNSIRLGNPRKRYELKTTGQIMIDPKNLTLIYRPIWCDTEFNYDKLNSKKTKTYVEVWPFPDLHSHLNKKNISFKKYVESYEYLQISKNTKKLLEDEL